MQRTAARRTSRQWRNTSQVGDMLDGLQGSTLEARKEQPSLAFFHKIHNVLGPVVQSVVSLTSSLRVISLTVLADSIHNILIFFAEKNVSSFCTASYSHFFSKKIQHICVSPDVNFNKSLTNDIISFEQPGPGRYWWLIIWPLHLDWD